MTNQTGQPPLNWRASTSFEAQGGQEQDQARQVVYDALVNLQEAMDFVSGTASRRAEKRVLGGIDKSIFELSEMLGQKYVRQYHNDGCLLDSSDDETGGHDGTDGCEDADVSDYEEGDDAEEDDDGL